MSLLAGRLIPNTQNFDGAIPAKPAAAHTVHCAGTIGSATLTPAPKSFACEVPSRRQVNAASATHC